MSDNTEYRSYAQAMERGQPYIRLTLDVPDAIELHDFVGAFTSIANEYERFIKAREPGGASDSSLYVGQVREGSIIAYLVPFAPMIPEALNFMSQTLAVEDFVTRYGRRIGLFRSNASPPQDLTRSELRDFEEQVAAIANTPKSKLEIAAIEIEDGEHKVRAAFRFRTEEARRVVDNLASASRLLDQSSRSDRERVLMIFTRSDVGMAKLGKRSGERVRIPDISDKPRPLIYASEIAESRIKREITEAEENVYKKGFVVDVHVTMDGERPIAYAVTNLHQVIDLPDEEED